MHHHQWLQHGPHPGQQHQQCSIVQPPYLRRRCLGVMDRQRALNEAVASCRSMHHSHSVSAIVFLSSFLLSILSHPSDRQVLSKNSHNMTGCFLVGFCMSFDLGCTFWAFPQPKNTVFTFEASTAQMISIEAGYPLEQYPLREIWLCITLFFSGLQLS